MGKMKHIPLLLLAAVLAVGCSQDELFDPAGEGQRPLVIKATGLSVTEAGITRATVDGSWDGDETVAVSVTDDEGTFGVFSYTAASDGTLTSSSPYFWKAQPIEVMAWYPYSAEFPTTVTVDADQSTLEGFKGSDALEASRELTENDCELEFSHRVAKVTFKLKGESTALDGLSDVTVVGVTGVDGGGNSVTPYQPDAAVHTYQALLAPQTLAAGKTALTLTKDNFTYAWVPDNDYKLVENYSYTFDLTVSNFDPNIKLTGCTITDWTDGGSYDENVPIPDTRVPIYVNLAELTEEYVINDGEYYVFSGYSSYGIKVMGGNPDIRLENAQISVSSGHAIDIQRGNPTIHVRGKDNKVSTDDGAGIYVAENYTVTITGNSQEDAITVTGSKGGAGIGAYYVRPISNSCGDINISNVTITAKAISDNVHGHAGSGIGSAGVATVGSINISNAIVYAEGFAQDRGYYAAAAIGGGTTGGWDEQTEFDITISNSTIHVTQKCAYSSYIGASGHYNRRVEYDIISTARITDSTIYKYTDDPSSSVGSVYYNANGNRTDQ